MGGMLILGIEGMVGMVGGLGRAEESVVLDGFAASDAAVEEEDVVGLAAD